MSISRSRNSMRLSFGIELIKVIISSTWRGEGPKLSISEPSMLGSTWSMKSKFRFTGNIQSSLMLWLSGNRRLGVSSVTKSIKWILTENAESQSVLRVEEFNEKLWCWFLKDTIKDLRRWHCFFTSSKLSKLIRNLSELCKNTCSTVLNMFQQWNLQNRCTHLTLGTAKSVSSTAKTQSNLSMSSL